MKKHRLAFHGDGGSLFGIWIVNALLTLVTCGVYGFWGNTRIRRYMWGQTEVEGDRFAYHGTGRDLLIGWIKASILFGGLFAIDFAVEMMAGKKDPLTAELLVRLISGLVALAIIPYAVVGSHRYRLTRTSWRGIRFAFSGKGAEFQRLFVGGVLLTIVTLGFYYPFFITKMRAYLARNSAFGTERFSFDGKGQDLLWPYIKMLLLLPFTLGLVRFWWRARIDRYFWEHTELAGARFESNLTGRDLLNLTYGNLFLLIITLGLASPWTQIRKVRLMTERIRLSGEVDLDRIHQAYQTATATGEGFGDFLDTGGFLELELGF